MAEETMQQAVMQEQHLGQVQEQYPGQVQEQYPGWRWDGVQWVQEENAWSGAQQEQVAAAGGEGFPTLQEEYTGSLQGGEANADPDAYLRQENYYQQQQQDFSSQEPYSNRQESPQKTSPEPPGGSSPDQEPSPSHTVTDPTPSPPEGFLGFNPSSLPPVAETPAYEANAQRASFDPSTLPPPRRTSLTDPPSRLDTSKDKTYLNQLLSFAGLACTDKAPLAEVDRAPHQSRLPQIFNHLLIFNHPPTFRLRYQTVIN